MKILDVLKNKKVLVPVGVFALGLLIGWLLFRGSARTNTEVSAVEHSITDHELASVWTCSMHPQIRADKPGKCPICGMTLVQLASDDPGNGDDADQYTIRFSDVAMKIAEVEVSTIEKKAPYKEIYLPGKVTADERNISALTARYPGRIEKLSINYTGQKVRKGQVLAKIYSPQLVTAQRELFEAVKFKETNPGYYKASRNKLKLWDLTDDQIASIENSGEVAFYFNVLSPITGTVTMRNIAVGDYVKEGDPLLEVVDLSHVWIMFDAYESDIPWIKIGDKIKFKIKSIPAKEFVSTVTFVDPVLDRMSRVAGVRAELNNPENLLKPQMLASGILKTMLPGAGTQLVVPKSAILWTGKNAVVYVMTNDHNNMFQYREIELGAEAGDYYVVANGLQEGEKVATHGVFKIDAAAQLKGERSMMNPEGGKVSTGMAGMDMGGDSKPKEKNASESKKGAEKMIMEDGSIMNASMAIDSKFKKQLTLVVRSYLVLKDAFVASSVNDAVKSSTDVKKNLAAIDMNLLKGDNMMMWMDMKKPLDSSIDVIINSSDIEAQRLAFADLSEALYKTIKMFNVSGLNIYYQFCPMARDSKGANWLSESNEIRNPYLGEKMLSCGETTETIK